MRSQLFFWRECSLPSAHFIMIPKNIPWSGKFSAAGYFHIKQSAITADKLLTKDKKLSRIFWDYTEKLYKKPYLYTGNRTEI